MADATPVISCYEAGRDGFWLHRWLLAQDVMNHVVDSSSIEVNRRARRAKTDKLDLAGLLNLLARYRLGDQRVWRVVRVPRVADEDARQLHRSWETLQQDRTRLICRLQGLLTTPGVRLRIGDDFLVRLAGARLWEGTPVPPGLQARLVRVWAQLALLTAQLGELETARAALPATMSRSCRRCAGLGQWAPGCSRPKSSAGDRFRMPGNSAAWSAWCPRRFRVARPTTIKALPARAINTCAA